MDILAISETWLSENSTVVVNEILPKGMIFYGRNREHAKGGGVGICLKEALFDKTYILQDDRKSSFEHLCIVLKKKNNKDIKVIVIYRLLNNNNFLDEFESLLLDNSIGSNVLILGDFNIHINNKSKIVTDFHNLLSEHNLKILNNINISTHNKGNTLDLIIASENLISSIINVSVHNDFKISDHYPVSISLNYNTEQNLFQRKLICHRDYTNLKYDNLGLSLQMQLYENNIFEKDIEELTNFYNKTLIDVKNNIPERKFYVRTDKEEPWYNGEINFLRKERRRRERYYKNNRSDENKKLLNQSRNAVTYKIRQSKRNHLQKKVENFKEDSKYLYKIINPLIKQSNVESPFNAQSHLKYFSEKIKKIELEIENMKKSSSIVISNLKIPNIKSKFNSFDLVSEFKIEKIIKK